jgi:hypothetical protein
LRLGKDLRIAETDARDAWIKLEGVSMADVSQLEDRVSALEHQVAEMRQSLEPKKQQGNWLEGFIGLFKDYPDFQEMVRLGQEYRRSQRFETHG